MSPGRRRGLAGLALALTILLFGTESGAAARRALLVGINEYREPSIRDLRGAVNDVRRMREVLRTRFRFADEDIRVLADADATRAGIVGAFRQLVASTHPGDIVVFHFSGHGSQTPDASAGDESDRWDETLVPYDGRTPGVRDIRDDEIDDFRRELLAITPHVTFVIDSCHSGTGAKGGGRVRAIEPEPFARPESGGAPGPRREPPGSRFALFAASRSDQLARELARDDHWFGVFTYYLTEELWSATAALTNRQLVERVRVRMSGLHPSQRPQLEGPASDGLVFGSKEGPSAPYVLVRSIRNGSATLDAGRALGITRGSVYDVYGPQATSFADTSQRIARIGVREVSDYEAAADVLEGARQYGSARAVLRKQSYATRRLRVAYQGSAGSQRLEAAREALARLPYVRETDPGAGYHILVREVGARLEVEAPDTTRLMTFDTSARGWPAKLRDGVADRMQWLNILDLSNPSSRLKVSLEVERVAGGERLRPGEPVRNGEEIAVRVHNHADRTLFYHLLLLSMDGGVDVVDFAASALPPRSITPPGASLRFQARTEGARESRDVVKVLAATRDLDLRPLERKPGEKGPPESRDPLEALLYQLSRNEVRTVPVAVGDWTTDQVEITTLQATGDPE